MNAGNVTRLVLLAALWGGSYLFIRIAAPVLGPILLMAARLSIAAVAMALYVSYRREPLKWRQNWKVYLAIGALNSAIPFTLIAFSTLTLPASITSILIATSPMFGALVAALWFAERITVQKAAGMVLGFVGVALMTGLGTLQMNAAVIGATGASLIAALCYGIAGCMTRAYAKGCTSLQLATGSQVTAAALLLLLVPIAPLPAAFSTNIVMAVLVLGLFCTAFAYLLYFHLVTEVGPTSALTVTYLVPLFGVLWGILFLHESITAGMLLGGAVIVAGTVLVTSKQFSRGRNSMQSHR